METSLENLIQTQLKGAAGKEVVMSHVTLSPNTALPKHYHPGEEFAYVMDGSFVMFDEEGHETTYKKGDYGVVPYKKVHSIKSGDQGTDLLVFRVHEQGGPERILVD